MKHNLTHLRFRRTLPLNSRNERPRNGVEELEGKLESRTSKHCRAGRKYGYVYSDIRAVWRIRIRVVRIRIRILPGSVSGGNPLHHHYGSGSGFSQF